MHEHFVNANSGFAQFTEFGAWNTILIMIPLTVLVGMASIVETVCVPTTPTPASLRAVWISALLILLFRFSFRYFESHDQILRYHTSQCAHTACSTFDSVSSATSISGKKEKEKRKKLTWFATPPRQ